MQIRLLAVAAVVTASLAVSSIALATGSSTAAPQHPAKAAHPVTTLRYTFDRGETLRPGTLVHDTSRHHHPGRVLVADRGHLSLVRGVRGHGAGFPSARCLGCRKAIIEAPDRIGLDPRRHRFFFGVAVKVTRFQARGDSNLVQKGYFDQLGGQYKLQMFAGVPSCVVFGGRGRLIVASQTSVADGTWHNITCRRTRDAVTLRVDRRVVGRLVGRTGLIANDAPVRVGGKNLHADNDQYYGDLDNVFLRITR